jgi:GH18 family chitinase
VVLAKLLLNFVTSRNLDMINVMVYDFHGAFESFVGHYAPLYASSLDATDEQKTLNVVRKQFAIIEYRIKF